MTKPKPRPPTVTVDPNADPFPEGIPRAEDGAIASNVEMSPDQLRSIGALDVDSALANKRAMEKAKAMMGPNPTSVTWGGVDDVQKYDTAMSVWGNGSRVTLKRVKPINLETTYTAIPAESVPTHDAFVDYVRSTIWDGEASTFDWTIRTGSLSRANGHLILSRDDAVAAAWRNRTAPAPLPYPQHLGAPPMQQPPWGPPAPPPYPYPHQPPPPPQQAASAPLPAPVPPPQQAAPPPPAAPQTPPRVRLPDGTLGYVIDGEVVVPASYMQPAPTPQPPPPQPTIQPIPPPPAPVPTHQRVKLPDGSVGFVIDGEVVVPWAQAQRQAPPPPQPPPPAPPAPPMPPPSPYGSGMVSGPPGLPPMPPPVQPFWNPYKGAWEYPQFQPPAPPAPPQPPPPPAPPPQATVPVDDLSALARGFSAHMGKVREVSDIVQQMGPMFGLQPAANPAAAAGAVVEGAAEGVKDGKFNQEDPFFDWNFFRTLKKGDGTPDMDIGLGHLAINADKIKEHVESLMKTRMDAAKLNVELERQSAETERIRLDNEMRRRALDSGNVRQAPDFPVASQESSPSLPAQAQGGFNPYAALHGPPDENPSDNGGNEGPTTAELPRRPRSAAHHGGGCPVLPVPDAGSGGAPGTGGPAAIEPARPHRAGHGAGDLHAREHLPVGRSGVWDLPAQTHVAALQGRSRHAGVLRQYIRARAVGHGSEAARR